MYILVKKENVKNEELLKMYHEQMPDGRLILPMSDMKMLGSVAECEIVATASELKDRMSGNLKEQE